MIKFIKRLSLLDKVIGISVVVLMVFFVSAFYRKADYVTVTLKLGEDNVAYNPWYQETGSRAWFVQMYRPGMKEVDGLGRAVAEVLKVNSYDTKPGRSSLFLKVKLMAVYSQASNQYTFNGLPLVAGSTVRLNLDTTLVEGLVVHVEGVSDPRKKVKLKVEAQLKDESVTFQETNGVDPFVANEILKVKNVYDGEGNVIIEVLEVKVEDAKRVVTTQNGGVLIQRFPIKKDVYMKLSVNAFKVGDKYFLFDDAPILIGEKLPFNTDKLSVFPTVTSIETVE